MKIEYTILARNKIPNIRNLTITCRKYTSFEL